MPITYSNKQVFLNGLEVADISVDGIDTRDYPDFCDAFIDDASILENEEWRDATEDELDQLNEDSDLVYRAVENHLY